MENNMLMELNNMSGDELSLLQNKIINVQMQKMQNQIKTINDEVEKLKAENQLRDNNIEKFKTDMEVKEKSVINCMQIQADRKIKDNWLNQGNFGRSFIISISSQAIGKLFKVVGLAQKFGATKPKRDFINKGYVRVCLTNNGMYTFFEWHYEKCFDFILKWLKRNNKYNEFYSIENEKDMTKFINNLYKDFINQ